MRLRQLFEEPEKHVAFCFGRMNPPTIGHAEVFKTLSGIGGDYFIFVTQTQDRKENPLSYDEKINFIKSIHPQYAAHVVDNPELNTVVKVASYLYNQGYKHATFVAGSDRLPQFQKLLTQYNGVEGKAHGFYDFELLDFKSSGERDPDSPGVSGVSASKARAAAANNDMKGFQEATGAGEVAKQMFNAVRQGMGIKESVTEGVDIGQEWMSDTELDQYIPAQLQDEWRELLGFDEEGNAHPLWVNMTGDYEPNSNDPQHRAWMVKVANKWLGMKKIPNVRFFDVKDTGDELEWLVQIGEQGVAEGEEDIVAVIDGVRSDRTYNDRYHAHNSLGKLVAYGKAKVAELYINGKKVEHFEIGKKYIDFEPKQLDQSAEEGLTHKLAGAALAAANLLGSPAQAAEEPVKPITIAYVKIDGEVRKYNLGDKFSSAKEAEQFITSILSKQGLQGYQLDIKHGYPKKKEVNEAPIEMDPADPMDPMIHSHDKANPAKLKYRMMRAAGQIKDLASRVDNASPGEWQSMTRQFEELKMNMEQIRHALEELSKIRKKGGIRSRGIDPYIS